MNYLIEYKCINKDGFCIKQGKMKVKNKLSDLHAKSSLEDHLKKKFNTMKSLIVISCKEHTDIQDMFGDIFGVNNPFK